MNSRMSKYDSSQVKTRTAKNEKLYDEVQDMNIDYIDINVDNSVELDSSKVSKNRREDYQKLKKFNIVEGRRPEKISLPDEEIVSKKTYDINEILSKAKERRTAEDNKKRLINTEYNILNKLNLSNIENEDLSTSDLHSLIEAIYKKELEENPKPTKKKQKRYIEDDDNDESPLFEDLMDEENKDVPTLNISKDMMEEEPHEIKGQPVAETMIETISIPTPEPNKNVSEETSDYTSVREDFVTDTDITELDIPTKNGKALTIIIIIVILVLALVGYLLYNYFGTL